MRIISWNINGLRSVRRKGFEDWLKKESPDIVCLQEIKTSRIQETFGFEDVTDYYTVTNPAKRPGYAGVAVCTKKKPLSEVKTINFERFDNEGRFILLDYGKFVLINLYMPHGGRSKENMEYKLESYGQLLKFLHAFKNRKIVIAGDFNIAHNDTDLARPQQNRNNTMFTPQERAILDKIVKMGFIDSFRVFNKEGGSYTWWPYFANARERNLGWRIDYIFVSENLAPSLKSAFILPGIKGSDHCPVAIDLEVI